MINDLIAALFGGQANTADAAPFTSRLFEEQTALIELFAVTAAVLLVGALIFIIIRLKRKNRGRN